MRASTCALRPPSSTSIPPCWRSSTRPLAPGAWRLPHVSHVGARGRALARLRAKMPRKPVPPSSCEPPPSSCEPPPGNCGPPRGVVRAQRAVVLARQAVVHAPRAVVHAPGAVGQAPGAVGRRTSPPLPRAPLPPGRGAPFIKRLLGVVSSSGRRVQRTPRPEAAPGKGPTAVERGRRCHVVTQAVDPRGQRGMVGAVTWALGRRSSAQGSPRSRARSVDLRGQSFAAGCCAARGSVDRDGERSPARVAQGAARASRGSASDWRTPPLMGRRSLDRADEKLGQIGV